MIRRGDQMGSTLQRKCARFTCFRCEDSLKYLNEIIFTRDGAVPRCLYIWSVIYPTKGKHSREREHPLWTVRSFRFHAENSCIKI